MRALAEDASTIAACIRGARATVEEAAQLTRMVTEGSSSSLVEESLGQWGQAGEAMEEAAALCEVGAQLMEDYADSIGGGGGATSAGGGGGGGPPVPAAGGGDRSVPPLVRRLADRLPDREPGAKTRLYAYSHDDGVETEFVSGRDRSAREGLTAEFAHRFVVRDHAEGHVAAAMRRPNGPHDVTVVINNEPCSGPMGCDATIPHIIPEGARMDLYLKTGGGVRWYATYRGTAEGIG